jgi:hypothetical protein
LINVIDLRVNNVIDILYQILGLTKPEPEPEATYNETKQAEIDNIFVE